VHGRRRPTFCFSPRSMVGDHRSFVVHARPDRRQP
jgi:hypothetical protein